MDLLIIEKGMKINQVIRKKKVNVYNSIIISHPLSLSNMGETEFKRRTLTQNPSNPFKLIDSTSQILIRTRGAGSTASSGPIKNSPVR